MRAALIRSFGPPEVLEAAELPDPGAGAGQVLVDVRVASVTFVETQIRAGRPPHPSMAPALPAVLGNGVAGAVAAVGEGVDAALVGRVVVTATGGAGGYASRALAPAGAVIPVPEGLDPEAAAALLADGRTATMLMGLAEVRPGETVLVEAAAGGVGSLLVQLARAAGARVVAAAGGPAKCRLAMEVGANAAVDYGEPGWAERAGAVDVAFDGVGGAIGEAAFGLVRAGGRFLPYGMASGAFAVTPEDEATRRGVRIARGGRSDPAELVAFSRRALDEAAAGRLRPVIGQRVPLERAADAHRAIEERRTTGKTLLLVE